MGEPIPIVKADFDKGEIYSLYRAEEDGKIVYALMFHAKESSYIYSQINGYIMFTRAKLIIKRLLERHLEFYFDSNSIAALDAMHIPPNIMEALEREGILEKETKEKR